ncbi:MAG: bifunctional isocitrate dehydrogenase kinase/phosphatase [Planctomycetes bacterium]|nr:bifunctional isocitrate dehydrogenase kinase/phosphatase [Planctomycetota bacterium]
MSDLGSRLERWLDGQLPAWRGRNGPYVERAIEAFAQRRWDAQRAAARERVQGFDAVVDDAAEALLRDLGARPTAAEWTAALDEVRGALDPLRARTLVAEIAERLGLPVPNLPPHVDPRTAAAAAAHPVRCPGLRELLLRACRGIGAEVELGDVDGDATWLRERFAARGLPDPGPFELWPQPFFRNQRAYVVGRSPADAPQPFAVALVHRDDGVRVDALLLGETEVVAVFAFSRSYLFVRDDAPAELVAWLSALLPAKHPEQLFINIGHPDVGKACIRASLLAAAERGSECFVRAPGVAGLVMAVFTAAGLDWVVKVPRDTSRPPKATTPSRVLERYRFVAAQDRVGRLADSQLLRGLELPVAAFAPQLLDELLGECGAAVSVDAGRVRLRYALVERRLVPLDVFLREADPDAAHAAVVDYGRALEDLARTNVFAGDLLPKNFGVGSDGRVVLYDFDDVTDLGACRFRAFPEPRDDDELWAAEPQFPVCDGDVFPAEFRAFVPPPAQHGALFRQLYEHLFTPAFWNHWREFHARNVPVDLPPYRDGRFAAECASLPPGGAV